MNWLRSVVARWQAGDRVAVFVPCPEDEKECLVEAFYELLEDYTRRSWRIVRLVDPPEHWTDVVAEHALPETPQVLSIFAYPDATPNGFRTSKQNRRLLLRWWDGPQLHFEFLFAHVPSGVQVLRRPNWSRRFPHWAAFNTTIRAYLQSEKGQDVWREAVNGALKRAEGGGDGQALCSSLEAMYERMIQHLDKSFDEQAGDALNMMYLQICLNGLTPNTSAKVS